MAASRTSNPPSTSSKPTDSPAQSLSSASIHSQDGHFALPPPHTNGAAAKVTPPKKPPFSSRISGIFGRKDGDRSAGAPADRVADRAPDGAAPNGATSPKARPAQTRRSSGADKKQAAVDRARAGSDRRKEDHPQNGATRRFWTADDGAHEHHLKVARRNERLTTMFRDLMLGKKREVPRDEQPLSLMANWADQIRTEKDKAPPDAKGGANSSQSLVQKYGKCQEVVGRGAFGVVRVAHKTDANDPRREQLFAVKEFRQRPGESSKKYTKRLTAEFCLSSLMQHPNVIQTLDLLQDDKGEYCEVMEYCAGGDLYTLILSAGQLEAAEADCFFKQLMRGVEYLHEMGVAHRDLKPENLLLTSYGSLKITDFGNSECFRMAWEKEPHMVAGLCGSAPYIAPEEYVDYEFDPRAVDVWACGIIYMAMRTGRHLWRLAKRGEDEFFDRYLEDRKEESGYRPIEVLRRRQCRNVIYSILDPMPGRRLTAHQVLHSEWVKDVHVCHAGNEGL